MTKRKRQRRRNYTKRKWKQEKKKIGQGEVIENRRKMRKKMSERKREGES